MQKALRLGLSLLTLFPMAAVAQRGPTVNQVAELAALLLPMKKIALAPIATCPGALDCGAVEKELYKTIFLMRARSEWRPAVVSPDRVRQKMFDLGLVGLDEDLGRSKVAEALGVDLLVIPSVPYIGSKSEPQTLFTPAGNAPEARVEMLLVSSSHSPAILFRGLNQGQATTYNSAEGVASRLLAELLGKAFPR